MKANGEDIKTIRELLRHATFKVTADTYKQAVTPGRAGARYIRGADGVDPPRFLWHRA
jgi:hypothetical protein